MPLLRAVIVVAHGERVGVECVSKLGCAGAVESAGQDSWSRHECRGGLQVASSPVQQRWRRQHHGPSIPAVVSLLVCWRRLVGEIGLQVFREGSLVGEPVVADLFPEPSGSDRCR